VATKVPPIDGEAAPTADQLTPKIPLDGNWNRAMIERAEVKRLERIAAK
jgi:hypothetical protein